MSANDLLPWDIGMFAFAGTVLLAIVSGLVGGTLWLANRLSKIDDSIRGIERSLATIGASLDSQIQLTGIVAGTMRRQGVLNDSDLAQISHLYIQTHAMAIRSVVDKERRTHNPLSASEVDRLDYFIAKAVRDEQFRLEEIQELQQIAAKLEKEKGPIDPGVIALSRLGELLLGTWQGLQQKN